jgi:hypothetical protein
MKRFLSVLIASMFLASAAYAASDKMGEEKDKKAPATEGSKEKKATKEKKSKEDKGGMTEGDKMDKKGTTK